MRNFNQALERSLNREVQDGSRVLVVVEIRRATNSWSSKMKVASLRYFKKKFQISQADVNRLARLGYIGIQQSGYVGHVTQHHKLVVFPDDFNYAPARRMIHSLEESVPLKSKAHLVSSAYSVNLTEIDWEKIRHSNKLFTIRRLKSGKTIGIRRKGVGGLV